MTVFPDGTKERLHGHNYYLSLTVELDNIRFDSMIDFGPIKSALGELCSKWKECTMLATENPFFELVRCEEDEIEFLLCKQRYVLPRADVLLLPIDNMAVEPLSAYACDWLLERLSDHLDPDTVVALEVTVEETLGQGGTTRRHLKPDAHETR